MAIQMTFVALQQWPVKPTPHSQRRRSQFNTAWSKTIDLLERELAHLRAKNVVIQADCDRSEIRIDGQLRANAKLRGPGVVISFECPKGAMSFPCDTFHGWQDNVRGIALSLEALRSVDRYGVTQRAEQYKGWAALPDRSTEQLTKRQRAAEWMVQQLFQAGVQSPPNVASILDSESVRRTAYLDLAKALHPDRCGSDVGFKQLQDFMTAF